MNQWLWLILAGDVLTIAIVIQVNDGVVLASDSASTLMVQDPSGAESIANVYNNANKIFNLLKGLPIGAMTYGMGSIGASSISTLTKDLRRRFSGEDRAHIQWALNREEFTVEEVAKRAREFLYDEHYLALGSAAPHTQPLGFVVTGYSAGAQLSETWLIEIKDGKCAPPALLMGQGVTNAYAGGDPELFNRVVNGYSSKLPGALKKLGASDIELQQVMSAIDREVFTPLLEPPMPIQDAIDLAEFLASATSMFTRFKRGAPTVGGPIEIAVITKHEHFKWVKRKHYFDDTLNPRGV